ncbi:uncharacterized protein AB675_7167 [Cyphellophora attinorum]|uniref:alpha-L-rhamnosidase n=1 Tax=Cyphellophora attinorum TaxID=1664694 RepID=A0A0N1HUU5_9EURO|nr:uncharacterized protein AB675_7167 [Phialophora attinorum]KPI43285.1 hypothetical protein AB675_7167 [Phialophora attinorum]
MTVVKPAGPSFEHHHSGIGIQCARPRISWQYEPVKQHESVYDWSQTAYELEIVSTDETQASSYLHRVDGEESILVPWPAQCSALRSRECRRVRIRGYGRYKTSRAPDAACQEDRSEWSDWAVVEAGLLDASDWGEAVMITLSEPFQLNSDGSARPLTFRKCFESLEGTGSVTRARLYATSHGVYRATLNGSTVGDQGMSPGWQSFKKRLHYQVYDVTSLLLLGGPNTLTFDVGPGWYASALTWELTRFCYGKSLGLLARLEIDVEGLDETIVVCSDPSWRATTSSVLSSEIYGGETFDQARVSQIRKGSEEVLWRDTKRSDELVAPLTSPEAPPVRVTAHIPAVSITKARRSKHIIDFGQNIAGRVLVKHLLRPAGHQVTFRHAEVLTDGELETRPLREAHATDTIICDGTLLHNWHPLFTFHGFRYVEVDGWTPEDPETPLTTESIVAEVMHCDMERTGTFYCSNDEINRLHENAVGGMRSNFLSIPSECSSRDERLGWTGDINIFAPVATFLYDTVGMLRNWLEDLCADQMMDEHEHWQKGVVPLFVPCLPRHTPSLMPNGVWGDAAVMVPWQLFMQSGDVALLGRQYDSMKQYLEHGVRRGSDGLWHPEQWQFGDWLDPNAPVNDSGRGRTDGTFVADCYLVQSTKIVAMVAERLGNTAEARNFQSMSQDLLSAFQNKYITPCGLIVPDSPTALALAIAFDLTPSPQAAVSRLSRSLRTNDFRITTGFVGTAHLLHSLSKSNMTNLAYQMLLSKSVPSLLYPVRMGATTIWERWDAIKPDGTVNQGSMTSFNHHALGSCVSWLHEYAGGIKALSPGWKTFAVKPEINRALTWVEVGFESPYGRIESRWELDGDSFVMMVLVPPNTHALVSLPNGVEEQLDEQGGREKWFGSGRYRFEAVYTRADEEIEAILPPWGRAEY